MPYHIDLWNHNVEFIEQEEQWARPAVFVEFSSIEWKRTKDRKDMYAHGRLLLHVVTDWYGSSSSSSPLMDESLRSFDLLNAIVNVMEGLAGESFGNVRLMVSHTNHNHEELIEHIEEYGYDGCRIL